MKGFIPKQTEALPKWLRHYARPLVAIFRSKIGCLLSSSQKKGTPGLILKKTIIHQLFSFFGYQLLPLLLLSGCMVGPNYKTPEVSLPSSYQEKQMGGTIDEVELSSWWRQFNDPLLNVLIHEAITQNFDLKTAIEKVNEVRALYQIEAANLFPKIDLTASQRRTRMSQTLFDAPFLGPPVQSLYQTGFDASWEIDIFGKLRREKEAALYEFEAEVENSRDVYITLLSEVARSYIEIRTLQNKIELLKKALDSMRV